MQLLLLVRHLQILLTNAHIEVLSKMNLVLQSDVAKQNSI
jgi:hypothetical protein